MEYGAKLGCKEGQQHSKYEKYFYFDIYNSNKNEYPFDKSKNILNKIKLNVHANIRK